MPAPLFSMQSVRLAYGTEVLFADVSCALAPRERVALVGRNGSGKSTLLKVAAGQVEADSGEIVLRPGAHAAYLPQEPDLSAYGTLREYVAGGLSALEQDETHRADAVLAEVGLDPDSPTTGLSGGEIRRAALARTLVGNPDLLLLDEPTNHLDITAIEWLEGRIRNFPGAVVVISHDRRFLEATAQAVLWLDRGVIKRLDRGFAHFEAWAEDLAQKEDVEQAKLDKLIAQETEWSHKGITARRKRNQGRLRRLYALRQDRAERIQRAGQAALSAESGSVSGKQVVEAKGVSKAFGDRVILKDFSIRILRGDRIGIVGPNGAGKTTLIKILTGELPPDGGTIRRGTGLTPVYLDQSRDSLDPEKTVWDTLTPLGGDSVMVGEAQVHVVSYLRQFLFKESQARQPVRALSGGERNRLMLARALAQPSNFLILDEPTNDLDMETLDLLQETLADYDGTILLVSHDRDFLDRVVTSTVLLDGTGRAIEYAGGFTDAIEQHGAPLTAAPASASKPKAAKKPAPEPAAKAPSKAPRAVKKLSYKQERRLAELPGEMAEHERKIALAEKELGDPNLYTRDPQRAEKLAKALELLKDRLAAAEEEWLDLETLREDLSR